MKTSTPESSINNQIKLGGIRATARNGVVCEFATKNDRDVAKAALDQCSNVTKYQVSLPKKPRVIVKFVPQNATEEDVLDAIGNCPGVYRGNCAVIKKLGKDDRLTRPYLVEVSDDDEEALLLKKHAIVCGFNRCLIEEQSNQCFSCYGFGHFAAQCTAQRCGKCACAEHQTKDCTANNLKCCNCMEKKVNTANVIAHGAFQTWLCPVAKSASVSFSRQATIAKNGIRAHASL